MTLPHPFDELRVGRFEAHGVAWIEYDRSGDWTIGRIDLRHLFDEHGESVISGDMDNIVRSPIIAELTFSREHRISLAVLDALRDEDPAADRGCEAYHFNRGAE